MNALAVTALLIAAGICGFLLYAGMALYERAKRPRHEHKWKTVRETAVHSSNAEITGMAVAHVITLQCEGCGDITTRKVKS